MKKSPVQICKQNPISHEMKNPRESLGGDPGVMGSHESVGCTHAFI